MLDILFYESTYEDASWLSPSASEVKFQARCTRHVGTCISRTLPSRYKVNDTQGRDSGAQVIPTACDPEMRLISGLMHHQVIGAAHFSPPISVAVAAFAAAAAVEWAGLGFWARREKNVGR